MDGKFKGVLGCT